MLPTRSSGWVGGRIAFVLLIAAPVLASDIPLFPIPLHIVRRVEDPIANTATELDEYCTGNRIITIRGAKTAIVRPDSSLPPPAEPAAAPTSSVPPPVAPDATIEPDPEVRDNQ